MLNFWKTTQDERRAPAPDAENGAAVMPTEATHVKSADEKKFMFKLDCCFLLFCCVSQIIKYLDQQNINFAYTAGMKDDLKLYGRELNLFTTYFNVGYCVAIIPSQMLITWFRPALYLSILELTWGILTFCYAACHSAKGVYAIRALVGVAESSAYPGAITLLMAWYSPTELAKRIGFYHSSQAMGGLMAGALQSAIYKGLDGSLGLAGWRWAFIINGIMTVIVAVAGFVMLPDFPDRPNRFAFWLNANDRAIAEDRLARFRRKTPKKANFATAKRVAMNPATYGLAIIYIGFLLSGYGSNYFNLFLKSLKRPDGKPVWDTASLSAVPIGGYAINIALSIGFAGVSDLLRTRWVVLLFMAAIGFPPLIILSIWKVPLGALYYAYFMLFVLQTASPLVWAWLSDMFPRNPEERGMIIGVCIAFYYATNAWANPLIYPADQAPHYKVGWYVVLGLLIASTLTILCLRIYDVKVIKPRNRKAEEQIEDEWRQAQAEANAPEGGDKHDIANIAVDRLDDGDQRRA